MTSRLGPDLLLLGYPAWGRSRPCVKPGVAYLVDVRGDGRVRVFIRWKKIPRETGLLKVHTEIGQRAIVDRHPFRADSMAKPMAIWVFPTPAVSGNDVLPPLNEPRVARLSISRLSDG